jgi:uncharacterized protein
MKQGSKPDLQAPTLALPKDMSPREIDQFLTCGRVGRLGMILPEGGPYIVPVGYGYGDGKIYFHTCSEGLKMEILRAHPNVCFEADESISDCSLAKSVIIFGRTEIIADKKEMIPYLEKLIDKYRVPVTFGEYMKKGNRDVQEELEQVRIVLLTPHKITGHKFVRRNGNF